MNDFKSMHVGDDMDSIMRAASKEAHADEVAWRTKSMPSKKQVKAGNALRGEYRSSKRFVGPLLVAVAVFCLVPLLIPLIRLGVVLDPWAFAVPLGIGLLVGIGDAVINRRNSVTGWTFVYGLTAAAVSFTALAYLAS